MSEQIEEQYHVYDNGGKTADRYTVFTHADHKYGKEHGNRQGADALGMDEHPTHPQGFSQMTTAKPGAHLGKKIAFHSLAPHLQKHVKERLSENTDLSDYLKGGGKITVAKPHAAYGAQAKQTTKVPSRHMGDMQPRKKTTAQEGLSHTAVDRLTKYFKSVAEVPAQKANTNITKEGVIMNEDFAPIADVITLVANDCHAEASPIVNDLLSARVLDALQSHKETIAQSLFAPSADSLSEETLEEKKWIAGAIKHPGALHRALHVPEGEKIPAEKLEAASHEKSKVGQEARLAKTLKKLHE